MQKIRMRVFLKYGRWSPLREFLYVDDLASAIKFVIENDISHDLINVGFGEEISIKDLAYKIKNVVGFKGNIDFDTTKPNGNPRKLLDTSIIKSYGWKPKFNLDEGLKVSYKWYKNN